MCSFCRVKLQQTLIFLFCVFFYHSTWVWSPRAAAEKEVTYILWPGGLPSERKLQINVLHWQKSCKCAGTEIRSRPRVPLLGQCKCTSGQPPLKLCQIYFLSARPTSDPTVSCLCPPSLSAIHNTYFWAGVVEPRLPESCTGSGIDPVNPVDTKLTFCLVMIQYDNELKLIKELFCMKIGGSTLCCSHFSTWTEIKTSNIEKN